MSPRGGEDPNLIRMGPDSWTVLPFPPVPTYNISLDMRKKSGQETLGHWEKWWELDLSKMRSLRLGIHLIFGTGFWSERNISQLCENRRNKPLFQKGTLPSLWPFGYWAHVPDNHSALWASKEAAKESEMSTNGYGEWATKNGFSLVFLKWIKPSRV